MRNNVAFLCFISAIFILSSCNSVNPQEKAIESSNQQKQLVNASAENLETQGTADNSIRAVGMQKEGRLLVRPATKATVSPLGSPSCYGQETDLRWYGDYEAVWEADSEGIMILQQTDQVRPNETAQWTLSSEMEKRYEQFAEKKDEELLRKLSPLDVFKFYVKASEAGDYEVSYALFIKDPDYDIPSYQSYINDISNDKVTIERSRKMWTELKQTHELVEEIDEKSAVIWMTDGIGNPKEEKAFQLIQNREGIWKVAWMPLQ
ncbi:hypothetical protein N0M98_29225 [Paenibacillus doosanensis]|uniref:hypothetical protein n=1 Tax=Paenibacillus doosanensis TaxID=1229154 RepID=UPI0021807353|nr:hypothetical protein [Paenibacillus doosanensis]MCS7464189.1 hypothetical protein [Paenibacillus doosanensis]